MFQNDRYLTCGVDNVIPLDLQMFLWSCVDEVPEYRMEYLLPSDSPINEKIYVIDDGTHSTMLLSSEY